MIKPGIRSGHSFYVRIYTSSRGGCVDEHTYTSGHDSVDNIEAAIVLADNGFHVQLLPVLFPDDTKLRFKFLSDVTGSKDPDDRINGRWIADFKKPERNIPVRKATISRFIESAAKQKAAIVIINLCSREYTIQDVKKGIIGAFQPNRNRSIKKTTGILNYRIPKKQTRQSQIT
ncbi:hypothetical protein [Pseudobacter ginsenosidimutans]|uniref:tRNA nuclease CdiA C-terminal domain-containing protein n=1 Tax=Pseudobacter ginsenosidimutans TaxID=661488 RepID=A0A4Q7MTD3_9BACT|nr:hypothetical protein [Pseudobacter ginsenosidimutans]QEC42002.1 hypothetical protein FSB84_09990 [Pseudobacter ginsenosidimutans]RZS71169.1 hypothetical protein EV199_3070 [Pseudobacter ginsenosidimutans]